MRLRPLAPARRRRAITYTRQRRRVGHVGHNAERERSRGARHPVPRAFWDVERGAGFEHERAVGPLIIQAPVAVARADAARRALVPQVDRLAPRGDYQHGLRLVPMRPGVRGADRRMDRPEDLDVPVRGIRQGPRAHPSAPPTRPPGIGRHRAM